MCILSEFLKSAAVHFHHLCWRMKEQKNEVEMEIMAGKLGTFVTLWTTADWCYSFILRQLCSHNFEQHP